LAESLGQWGNAPLVYVLAELRTERISDVKNYYPKFAGRLRDDGYPIQRTMHAAKVVATGTQMIFEPAQDPAWEFATPDNRTGVMLRPNGLVLHATAYEDEIDFLARLDKVVRLFAEEIPSVYVNRLGLRYIDFVLPRKGEKPEDYVDGRLNPDLGLAKIQADVRTTSVAIYAMGNGRQLTLRYSRGRGKPEMPPDLVMLSLQPSKLMNPPGVTDIDPTAVLDTDCNLNYSPVEKLDPKRVRDEFALICDEVYTAFLTAITEHARKIWEAK